MNKFLAIGRLTGEPDIRRTQEGTCVARYTLAVNRNKDEADFISCVAFGKAGEFAEKYLHKATKIAIVGRVQTGKYTNKEGRTVYTTDIVVENHEFVESKAVESPQAAPQTAQDEFLPANDEELPFR